MVKTILKGSSNTEATTPKFNRATISIDLMKKLKKNMQKHPATLEEGRMTWCAVTWVYDQAS